MNSKPIKWTKEKCQEESKKYQNRTDFCKGSGGCYNKCTKNGWIDEVCSHMNQNVKPNGYWDIKENCIREAKKYSSRTLFRNGCKTAWVSCCKNNWINDPKISGHMIKTREQICEYWSIKENCIKEAKKYNSKSEFFKKSRSCYSMCLRNGWINDSEISGHMISLGDRFNQLKFGYKMIFKSNIEEYYNKEFIYIGLTGNFERRFYDHLNNKYDNLYPSIKKYQLYCIDKFIYHDLINIKDAKTREKEEIKSLRQEGKYIVLNNSKGGECGCTKPIWTKDFCKELFKNCKEIQDCLILNSVGYYIMLRNRWIDELFPNLGRRKKKDGYWNNKQNIINLINENNIKCRSQLSVVNHRAYLLSLKYKWINELFPL